MAEYPEICGTFPHKYDFKLDSAHLNAVSNWLHYLLDMSNNCIQYENPVCPSTIR